VWNVKYLADLLTGTRALLAFWLVWLGLNGGAERLAAASVALIAAWTTDILDGPLARRAPQTTQTWLGDHDLEVDVLVSLGVWSYLTLSGFIAPPLAVAYVLLCVALLWFARSAHVAWGVQALPYGTLLWTALQEARFYGLAMSAWVVGAVVATWPRFPNQTVPEFVKGIRDLWR